MTADNKAESYDYVSKNDRLTLNNKSYALKDAKVIFAVKPHNADSDYIQHVSAIDGDKRVDEDDVLAVKVTDIPDISEGDDTTPSTLDRMRASTLKTVRHGLTIPPLWLRLMLMAIRTSMQQYWA